MKTWQKNLLFLLILLLSLPGLALATTSWENINQPIIRPIGWNKIVDKSPFALGEQKELKTVDMTLFEMEYGTYPSIDGSTVAVPMAMEFARQHLLISDMDIEGFVSFSTTHGAYEHLILKQPNLASQLLSQGVIMSQSQPVDLMIGTPPSVDELALAEAHNISLVIKPVCLDAFVFIVHKDNPVQNLTVAQVQKIYSGEIKSWAQVGGDDLPIQAFQRDRNSGSQTAMEEFVMKGVPLKPEETFVASTMGGLIEAVGSYENNLQSIGYTYKYYIDTLYKSDEIKTLAIEGILPESKNLRSETYPFTTPYYGVIRKGDEEKAGGLFLNWILTKEGQQCIALAGYVPVLEDAKIK